MSLAHLNQESRNELERRVLAAALKLSLLKGDKLGAKLAHQCLAGLLKIEKKPDQPSVGLTTTTEQVAFTDESEGAVSIDSPDVLEVPELAPIPENGTVYDFSSIEAESDESTGLISAPEQASDNKSEAENTILQLQKIGDRTTKPALNIDFELPPAEKAKMTAASAKPAKAVKPTEQPAKNATPIELTATAENQAIYGAEGEQTIAGILLPQFLTEPQVGQQYHALYKMLGVRQTATRDDIHKTFLRLVRRILRELKGAKRPSRQELLGYLRKVWIAHDILTDPNTRTDYDFRDLGLRGTAETEQPQESTSKPASTQMLLRIGELLQVAGLLETAELDIACDMHKAMPEMMFGTFLVRQGFIADSELESVLYGQKALRSGAISVAQFQVAMELSREKSLPVKDALVEKGFATQARLDDLDQQTEPSLPSVPVAETPIEVAPDLVAGGEIAASAKTNQPVAINENSSLESIGERLSTAQPLQISKAAPSWKDQLDWSTPAEEEEEEEEEEVPGVETKADELQTEGAHEVAPDVTPVLEPVQFVEAAAQVEETQSTPIEEAAPVQPKRETTVAEHEPGLFSHMREAASFYDAEEDFFSHYNYAQPGAEPAKADDNVIEVEPLPEPEEPASEETNFEAENSAASAEAEPDIAHNESSADTITAPNDEVIFAEPDVSLEQILDNVEEPAIEEVTATDEEHSTEEVLATAEEPAIEEIALIAQAEEATAESENAAPSEFVDSTEQTSPELEFDTASATDTTSSDSNSEEIDPSTPEQADESAPPDVEGAPVRVGEKSKQKTHSKSKKKSIEKSKEDFTHASDGEEKADEKDDDSYDDRYDEYDR